MSAASLVMLSRESKPSSKKASKSLRVNQAGDAFERKVPKKQSEGRIQRSGGEHTGALVLHWKQRELNLQ
jgi:hypothetical protein